MLEAAVVGVPSDLSEEDDQGVRRWSPIPAASTWPRSATAPPRSLTPFKVPRYLEAVTDLPRTPTGRVAKHRLDRDRTAQEADFA